MMFWEFTGQELTSKNLDINNHSVMTNFPEHIFHNK